MLTRDDERLVGAHGVNVAHGLALDGRVEGGSFLEEAQERL